MAVFHICDEPSAHNIMAWRKAAEFAHRYALELRRIDAIETPHCLGDLEIWVLKLDHLDAWRNLYEDAQRQGNELWFYTVGIFQAGSLPNKTVDAPLIESRLMHWLNYRFGLKGYLHWGFNAWTDDPIKAPGQRRGDGWHVYPKPGRKATTPMPTLPARSRPVTLHFHHEGVNRVQSGFSAATAPTFSFWIRALFDGQPAAAVAGTPG